MDSKDVSNGRLVPAPPERLETSGAHASAVGRTAQLQRLFELLMRRPGRSRAELGDAMELSRSTLLALLADAQEAGMLAQRVRAYEGGALPNGRPPLRIWIVPQAAYAVGLEVGPAHLRCVICDLYGRVVALRATHVDPEMPLPDRLGVARALAALLLREAEVPFERVIGAGVALPMTIDARTGDVPSHGLLPSWHRDQSTAQLRERLEMPVSLINDADAGALGERCFGVARGASNVFYLQLSNTVNAGLILRGRLHAGATGIAGELGHTRVAVPGRACRCGNCGCLNTVASSVAIAEAVSVARRRPTSVATVLELVRGGNREVRKVLVEAGHVTGRAIAAAVNLLNPELVVIGGELAAAGDALIRPIRTEIASGTVAAAKVAPSRLGKDAVVLGAATLPLERASAVLAARLA